MYLGKLCEVGRARRALRSSPRTRTPRALLAAIPVPDPSVAARRARQVLGGEIPSPVARRRAAGSAPAARRRRTLCAEEEPQIREVAPGQFVACHFPLAPGEAIEFR